jgi:hypothetical protein
VAKSFQKGNFWNNIFKRWTQVISSIHMISNLMELRQKCCGVHTHNITTSSKNLDISLHSGSCTLKFRIYTRVILCLCKYLKAYWCKFHPHFTLSLSPDCDVVFLIRSAADFCSSSIRNLSHRSRRCRWRLDDIPDLICILSELLITGIQLQCCFIIL